MDASRNYQNEKPVDTDLFSGQGHKQVADAIAKVLHSNSSLHIIGIEGNLGAGKSTVINILKQQIEANGFHIVTFDADQYHKNLKPALIKTIEVELKKILGKKSTTELHSLQKAVEKALGQRLEYTKDTKSHISLTAIFFGFLLAVAALQLRPALTFLFEFINGKDNLNITSGIISWVLLATPALLWAGIRCLSSNISLGDLVKRNSKDVISETIDINREVGAIELREAFSAFVEIVPDGKTLLLVIDNIDRIAPDIARELWSDIEILTSLGNERFRILLPYSEEHLAKALEKSSVDESQSGREFISKRIPVPFSAPPIVTTGWREQFNIYWSETLVDIEGRDGVKSLIDIWGNKITPRFLKSLVNRIGAKIDSCPEKNELLNGVCCAAYILAVRDNKIPLHDLLSDPSGLIQKKEDDETFKESVRKLTATHRVLKKYRGEKQDWAKQIAALHYQTSFLVAESELIAEPIRVAFDTHDTSALVALKPLLGFDVFFKQQIEETDSTELVKIAAALLNEEIGSELVHEYLNDINHELKESPHIESYEFDSELVDSYESLTKNNIEIDITPIIARQNYLYNYINNLCGKTQSVLPKLIDGLSRAIKDCYAYYAITEIKPPFIKMPKADFIVNALFPIANDISDWDIESLISKVTFKAIVKEACLRRESVEDDPSIFPLLLEKSRVGLWEEIEEDILLNNSTLYEIWQNVEAIPFTKDWHNSNKKTFAQNLAMELSDAIYNQIADEESINKLAACAIVAVMHAFPPTEQAIFRDHDSRRNAAITALQWVCSTINQNPSCNDYIVNYLSASSYIQIMLWCKQADIVEQILPHLETLIINGRLKNTFFKQLIGEDYSFVSKNKSSLTNSEHVNWVVYWCKQIKEVPPQNWASELVDDIILYEQTELLKILRDNFDDEKLTQIDWLNRIKQAHKVTERMVDYMLDKGLVLTHQQSLVNALKEIPNTNDIYNQNLVTRLTTLLEPQKKAVVTRSLKVAFFKPTTTHEQRYRSIRYFSDSIAMPSIKGREVAQEAIDLIEYIITKNNMDVLPWLMNQSIIKSGWNIDSWSLEDLEALDNTLASIKGDEKIQLLTEVRNRLRDEKEEAENDDQKLEIA